MEQIFRFRNRVSKTSIENAPKFAYSILYNRIDPLFTGKLYFSPKKLVELDNNEKIYVDEHLKDIWIRRLNNIKNIEIRSTCQGHDSKYITHIILRPKNQNLEYIQNKVSLLKKFPDTKCKESIGNGGLFRIGIVTKNWYRDGADNSKWNHWWENIVKYLETIFEDEKE